MVKVNSRTIQRLLQGHGQFIREADEARRYYSNVNRIKQDNSVLQRQAETEQALGNPLHLADNRISHSWHNLLVTQKVSYALSYPPVFDVGSKTANERIAEILGDQYTATAMHPARLPDTRSRCSCRTRRSDTSRNRAIARTS